MATTAPHTEMTTPAALTGRSLSLSTRADARAMKMGLLAMITAARPASISASPLKKKKL